MLRWSSNDSKGEVSGGERSVLFTVHALFLNVSSDSSDDEESSSGDEYQSQTEANVTVHRWNFKAPNFRKRVPKK